MQLMIYLDNPIHGLKLQFICFRQLVVHKY